MTPALMDIDALAAQIDERCVALMRRAADLAVEREELLTHHQRLREAHAALTGRPAPKPATHRADRRREPKKPNGVYLAQALRYAAQHESFPSSAARALRMHFFNAAQRGLLDIVGRSDHPPSNPANVYAINPKGRAWLAAYTAEVQP